MSISYDTYNNSNSNNNSVIKEEYQRYLRSDSVYGFQLNPWTYIDFINMYIIVTTPNKKVHIRGFVI